MTESFFGGMLRGLGGFWSGVVSGRSSAPSVCDIWAMRDDGPPGAPRCRAGQCLEFGHEGFEVSASDRGAV